jgi:hypothetical protein
VDSNGNLVAGAVPLYSYSYTPSHATENADGVLKIVKNKSFVGTDSNGDLKEATLPSATASQRGIIKTVVNASVVGTDAEGNLIEGSIDTSISAADILKVAKAIYPVGTVLISIDGSLDPNTKFPGTTWESFGSGRCLWGASTSNEIGSDLDWLLPQHTHGYTKPTTKASENMYTNTDYFNSIGSTSDSTAAWPPNDDSHIGDDIVRPNSIGVIFWKRTA